ncbi:MAG TPA: acyl-CoA dehydrogenase family protein [Solirubrobacterales bacterium]|nr:acyl-CoA dehydrogenase family protein [Solirubrobacterales bacterium]
MRADGRLALPWHERHRDIREGIRAVTDDFPLKYWDECEQRHEFPEEFFQAFARAGWFGMYVPEEYGGAGLGISSVAAVLEEIAASGGALDACTSVHTPVLWMPVLLKFGTEEQKREYLPQIERGELFVTFGVSEPNCGTDITRISTKAARTDAGWRIGGQKTWNSGALRGDKVLLVARTSGRKDDRPGEGLTLFLVDLDAPGLEIRPIEKYTRNGVTSCELFLDDVEVGAEDVIGEVDEGFYHLLASLNSERLLLSAVAMGIARWSIETAVAYAGERRVFDRAIGANQAVQHPLAEAYVRLVAASELVANALSLYDEGADRKELGALATSAKYLTSELAFFAADRAMQTHGGFAVAREYGVGRFWAEARIQRLAPIANEVALSHVAEHVLGLPRSY